MTFDGDRSDVVERPRPHRAQPSKRALDGCLASNKKREHLATEATAHQFLSDSQRRPQCAPPLRLAARDWPENDVGTEHAAEAAGRRTLGNANPNALYVFRRTPLDPHDGRA